MASLFQQRHPTATQATGTHVHHEFATPMMIEGDEKQSQRKLQHHQQQPHGATVIVRQISSSSTPAVVKKRLTTKYGSKYEKARLLGEWATKVSLGADPCVDLSKLPEKERQKYTDPLVLAQKALVDKTMPLGIRRFLEDGSYEDWFLDELIFD
jgi:DNA-directed RNA polymerase subunit K/omega